MLKRLLTLLLWLLPTLLFAGRPVDGYFITAPSALLPQLDSNGRKDLLDFYDAGQEKHLTNALGGDLFIERIDERQITLRLSSVSTLQIALLPVADTIGVIAVIHTVSLPASDSRIAFYDTQWRPLEGVSRFTPPTVEAFFDKGTKEERKEAAATINLLPHTYRITGESLEVTQTLADYLPEEIYRRIAPFLAKNPLLYRWNGKRFLP
ncbi:MAG: DUF3256 family protein [Porphyromonadaceae bacterium]|nr:DUF3256 family protein [Porphyromonadaceae bacterium]